ncbi:MAG: DUF1549 domain-containing protein, partial [Verrucomicrobiales bacterium]
MDSKLSNLISKPRHKGAMLLVFMAGIASGMASFGATIELDFNREVLPILSENCFACHGPDEQARKGKLRLDIAAEAKKVRSDGGYAIKEGKPEESAIIARILTADPDDVMPPPSTHKSLTSSQKEKLQEWIRQGAVYETHWAFAPVQRPAAPTLKSNPGHSPIDAFVVARLEQEGLELSPEASKSTLIRRLYLDLTGLPPSVEEVDRFLADKSPNAYQNLVDELLNE